MLVDLELKNQNKKNMALESFRTPQQATDESVDRFLKSSYNITDAIARSGHKIVETVTKQKEDQQKRNDERDLQMQQMFDKANEFGSTGDAKLDENILAFWNQKVDDYFTIKNAMQTGKIGKQEGNLALARINGLVGQFKAQSKYLAEQVALYREDFNNGIVSSTSSQQSQNILGAMAKGGNVQITEKGGVIYYYLPGEDGSIPNDGNLINGQQLIANDAAGKNLYNTIPDYSSIEETAYNNTIKPNDINSDYIVMDHVVKDGYKYSYATFNEKKRATAAEDMVNNGSFKTAIQNDTKMKSYYQDVIDDEFLLANGLAEEVPDGKGGTKIVHGSWMEYDDDLSQEENDEIHAKQKKAAQLYMANQAMDKFSIPPGGQQFFSKEKIGGNDGGSTKNRFNTTQQTIYDNRKDDFIANRDAAEEMYAGGVTPDAETFVKALQNANPRGDYFVNDKNLIQSGNSIITIPTSAKNASVILNEEAKIDRTMQNVFNKENPYKAPESEEEEEVDVNVATNVPDDADTYVSSATNKQTFDGVLTDAEAQLFNQAYDDAEFMEGVAFGEMVDKLASQAVYSTDKGLSPKAARESKEVKDEAIRRLKRQRAIEDKKDAEELGETMEQYYSDEDE